MAPVITSLSVNNAVINEDGSVTISGTFTDVGTQDTHAVSIDWGSGETSSVAVVVEANGSGSLPLLISIWMIILLARLSIFTPSRNLDR